MNLYVLKCANNKYYVGTTTLDTTKRLAQHMSGRGSAWTKKYKPLWIEKEIKNCDKYDEDKWTKIYMDKYGINNVRGGTYSQVSLPHNAVQLLEREVNHANQKCLFCGNPGHFINQCPSKKYINKKHQSKNLYYLNMSCDYEYHDNDIWYCDYCNKNFTSKKGATYHENFYCKKNPRKKKSNAYYKKKPNTYYKKKSNQCFNCGEKGHDYCG